MKFYLLGHLNMSLSEIAAALITVSVLLIADHFITEFRKNKKNTNEFICSNSKAFPGCSFWR